MDVLLDLDGTLLDPAPGMIASIEHAYRKLGRPPPGREHLAQAIGQSLTAMFTDCLGRHDGERALAWYRECYRRDGLYDVAVYPGIPAALDQLRSAGCRLFIASSKPHVFGRAVVARVGLAAYFAAVYGPELAVKEGKSALVARLIQNEGVARRSAVMVGDRGCDIAAAVAGGIGHVGVTWGHGSVEELTSAGAGVLCDRPAELWPAIGAARKQ
jgi:phosphoglycolate phosphatase